MSADFAKVDQNELDREWVQQPELYFTHAAKLAEAREKYDRAQSLKEIAVAETDREIRRNPQQFGLEKITEAVVQNTMVLQQKYQKANEACIQAKFEMDMASAKVQSLDHKKKTLEKLVDLFLANYFSKPQSKNHKERMERVETEAAFGHGKKRGGKMSE